jgi:hypothetical protein
MVPSPQSPLKRLNTACSLFATVPVLGYSRYTANPISPSSIARGRKIMTLDLYAGRRTLGNEEKETSICEESLFLHDIF